jgi:uncharacterized protein YdaT
MKKLIIALGIVVAGFAATAQNPQGPEEKNAIPMEKLQEELQLSESQLNEIKALRQDHFKQLKDIEEMSDMSRADKMRKRADAIEKHEQALSEILNEEQWATLQEMRENFTAKRKGARKQRRERRRGGQ